MSEFSAFDTKHHINLPAGYAKAAGAGQRPWIRDSFLTEDDAGAKIRTLLRQGDISYIGSEVCGNADDVVHHMGWRH